MSGSFIHGVTLNITGSGFGYKSPAAPLQWDDGEERAAGDLPTTVSSKGVVYNYAHPYGGIADYNWQTRYRNVNYRNVAPPHSRSSKYICGGHQETDPPCGTDASNVFVLKSAPSTSKTWYITLFQRLDPSWPTPCGALANYRVMLANNSNYNQTTIVEPQIPSAWSSNLIIVMVNLGNFPSIGSAYLFVFDSNNNHNSVGYPVTIGGGNPPPAAPTALRIGN